MKLDPRWQKVVRDLWANKPRTLLVVVAIAVGVFAFGSMFATRTILLDNMAAGVRATNQATLTFSMLEPFNEGLVRTVRTFPYVKEVEARSEPYVQVWTGKTWSQLTLISVDDFHKMDVNRITLEQGTYDMQRRQILVERSSLPLLEGAHVGSEVTVELPDSSHKDLQIVGVVHDFTAIPASQAPLFTAYASLDTVRSLGLTDGYDVLEIVTDPNFTTQAQLEVAADAITELLDRYGYAVLDTTITVPGKHWASDFVSGLVLVLAVLGTMALALSGFLVVNTIMALMTQQKRQIGMMKAVGARGRDVMGIYLAMSGSFGVLSLLVALPLGVGLSLAMTNLLANWLNINVDSFDFPVWVFAIQIGIAIFIPLISALIPVLTGMRTTVREAVSDYGITETSGNFISNLIGRIRGLPRPMLLSLRNTFRRTGRLALTLVTLTIAGAIFISIINTRNALLGQFDKFIAIFGYDIQVSLTQPQYITRLQREGLRVDGVQRIEGWSGINGTIIRPDNVVLALPTPDRGGPPGGGPPRNQRITSGAANADEGTVVVILAPPIDSAFIEPDISDGRWLETGDTNAIVLSTEVLKTEPYIQVGDTIPMDFGDVKRPMHVVGFINVIGIPLGYAPIDYVTRLSGTAGLSSIAMVGTGNTTIDQQQTIARNLEEHYQDIGIGVTQTNTLAAILGTISGQIDFLIFVILAMAGLLGAVGGLGLASTMSLNVLERTREIGVMRSIGASNGSVRSIFLVEGLLIGIISCVLASILSVPISYILGSALGNVFFQQPLALVLKPSSFIIWLIIALVIASFASLLPANRAAQISVRESISYE